MISFRSYWDLDEILLGFVGDLSARARIFDDSTDSYGADIPESWQFPGSSRQPQLTSNKCHTFNMSGMATPATAVFYKNYTLFSPVQIPFILKVF
jgi:hypothetical protein